MNFYVIDKRTGEYPDVEKIAKREEWAKKLIYCDIDCFALMEDGELILLDDCGNVAYCPEDRFEVVIREDDDEQMAGASEIELLLKSFGETLADLPQSDGKHFTYDEDKRKEADKAAFEFDRIQNGHYVDIVDSLGVMADLICHQSDVIEKLIRALKKAKEN